MLPCTNTGGRTLNYNLEFIRTVFTKANHLIDELTELRDCAIFAMGAYAGDRNAATEEPAQTTYTEISPGEQPAPLNKKSPAEAERGKDKVKAFLEFTKEDIAKMPKNFQKIFNVEGRAARITCRKSGNNGVFYEIRYRRDGYNISVGSTDLDTAKVKFIKELYNVKSVRRPARPKKMRKQEIIVENPFDVIAEEWFSTRRGKIDDATYKHYRSYYERFILPKLESREIAKIRTANLNDVVSQVLDRGRAYEDVRSILNQIFTYALYNGLIPFNPVKLVEFIKADRESGKALSYKQEAHFLQTIQEKRFDRYRQSFLILLFFGLRPCELEDARIEGDFLIARNRKRKRKKIEYKKIPVSPMAHAYIDFSEPIRSPATNSNMNKVFKKIFPQEFTPYDLRHTFSTRCQQFVRQEIVEIWMGDSPERLIGKAYTHFPDSFMLEEMSKVDYREQLPNVPQTFPNMNDDR